MDVINLNDNFWSFSNSLTSPFFQIKYCFSSVQYDNLANNNNCAPNQNIQCRFKHFVHVMKEGQWQGKVSLHYDIQGFFVAILNKGTHFVESFTDKKKMFQPWQYRGTSLQSYSFPLTSPTGNPQGTAIHTPGEDVPGKKEKVGDSTGNDPVSTASTAVYISKRSYCRGPDGDIFTQLIGLLAGNFKKDDDGDYWYFWHDRDDSAEMNVAEGE
jgi:hypothetical protein